MFNFDYEIISKITKNENYNFIFILNLNLTNYFNKNNKVQILKFLFFFYLFYLFPIILEKFYVFEVEKYSDKIENYYKLCNNGTLINNKKYKKANNPKISIISPLFDREKYILRFLRSIQNQFFDSLEIIFVDDCSTDNSTKLIEEYQKDDERIVLLKHKKNKGTLISRNDGTLFSKGEYLMFTDPDDLLLERILYNCYKMAKNNNYEMIRFNIYEGKGKIFYDFFVNKLDSRPIYQPELIEYLFHGLGYLYQIDFNLSNKFIKRDTYIKAVNCINNFYLSQYMTNLEDGIMNYILYRTSNSFYFTKRIGYYYIQNNQSITIKRSTNLDNTVRFIFIHLKFVFENSKNNKFEKDMANSLFLRLYNILGNSFKSITKDFKFYSDIINMYLNSNLINKNIKKILREFKFIIQNKAKNMCNNSLLII